jgi:alpha-aminoadipic semialdehyde synthase
MSLVVPFRLMVVSDISCDVNGSIEFLERSTTIDRPCYQYDPIAGHEVSDTIQDYGVTVMGVDILPSELPLESSTHFGNAVQDLLEELVQAKTAGGGLDISKLSPRLVRSNAIIVAVGAILLFAYRILFSCLNRPML